MGNEYFARHQRDATDKAYGDQYEYLFPDVEPPEDEGFTAELEDVGDQYLSSEDFVKATLNAYFETAAYNGGQRYYDPPLVTEMSDEVYQEYDTIMSETMAEQYEMMRDGKDLTDDEDSELQDLVSEIVMEDFALSAGAMIDEKICKVLNHYGYAYIEEDFVRDEEQKRNTTYKRIFNSSQQPLFNMTFSNTWDEGGAYDNDENIARGYHNLLRTGLEKLW